ncbi:redox-sensing transcriptional repressor Rex [Chitinispirillales bacterium ANBcel5]|uniref:redox-sensing transcriptional repressor Rex n=1 Tax=Cellulosispirillum alkaliphilum TaxID=3039283 RepID=UPI002A4EDA08|nr:redox-sensing transcriptional repressor Rex [Chitinispirillales bacterium ANBcel5]
MIEQAEQCKRAALPTIRRLPSYLSILYAMKKEGLETVSGTVIAEKMLCEPIQVRKDLAVTGIAGRPRIGFGVGETIEAIENFLGWNNTTDAFLIGAGSLGTALLGYAGFLRHNLNIIAAFDVAKDKVGAVIHGKKVLDIEKLEDLASRMHVHMAILTVPASSAQAIAERLIACGIYGLWNFTSEKILVPDNVVVQNEDLSSGLAVLCTRLRQNKGKG